MRATETKYHPGLEFYAHPSMGLCGIENDAEGNQRTLQYLTPPEATAWLAAWLRDEKFSRQEVRNQESSRHES